MGIDEKRSHYIIRKTNIELLRIFAMLSIIAIHYLDSSEAVLNIKGQLAYNVYLILETIFGLGVNIFVLITGYFMVEKNSVSIRKLAKLLFDISFYGIILYFISVIIKINYVSVRGILKSLLPMLAGYRWFVKAWLVLYVFSPFLNKILVLLTEKQYCILLIICFCFFSLWPTFLPNPPLDDYGFSFNHFIFMYAIAGYIKRFIHEINVKKCSILLFICLTSTYLISLLGESNIPFPSTIYAYRWAHNSPFNILASSMLFMIFTKKEFYNRFINNLASSAFAVFLIHGDFNTMDYLFNNICKAQNVYKSMLWIPYMFMCVIIIYLVCFFIDYIKKRSIDKGMAIVFDNIKLLNKNISV